MYIIASCARVDAQEKSRGSPLEKTTYELLHFQVNSTTRSQLQPEITTETRGNKKKPLVLPHWFENHDEDAALQNCLVFRV